MRTSINQAQQILQYFTDSPFPAADLLFALIEKIMRERRKGEAVHPPSPTRRGRKRTEPARDTPPIEPSTDEP